MGTLFWPEDTPAEIMREQRKEARNGREGCLGLPGGRARRMSRLICLCREETPSFSGGWLSPHCCSPCASLGKGAGDLGFVCQGDRSDLCSGGAGKLGMPHSGAE